MGRDKGLARAIIELVLCHEEMGIEDIFGGRTYAIEAIRNDYSLSDIFDSDEVKEHVRDNPDYSIEYIFDTEAVLAHIADHKLDFTVGEMFDRRTILDYVRSAFGPVDIWPTAKIPSLMVEELRKEVAT